MGEGGGSKKAPLPKIPHTYLTMMKFGAVKDLTRKNNFLEGWSRFKFNNLGLPLGKDLKFYKTVPKGLKLKVKVFCGLIPTFVKVIGEKAQ